MPGRFYGRRMSRGIRPIINSIKNVENVVFAIAASTNQIRNLAVAGDVHDTAVQNSVIQGSIIKAIWLEFWYYGLSANETNDIVDIYIFKNPGNNLTPPNPGTIGTSNEKKFVFKSWKGLAALKSNGGMPYFWRGWIKIPKRYQRMGTDDRLQLVIRSPTTGNMCINAIYKWYT